MTPVATRKRIEQRNHPEAPEQRTVDVGVESVEVRGNTIVGYAAVFGVESRDLGGFRETIAKGAFDNVLDGNPDVVATLNHNPDTVLGRTKSGTLRLSADERGLKFECDMPESRSDLREAVERGDLDGASFRFVVDKEEWGRADDGTELRTIQTVKELHDVAIATTPAYPEASIEMRTRPNEAPRRNGGGLVVRNNRLRVEDRNEGGNDRQIERRVVEAIQAIPRGQSGVIGEERSIGVGDATAVTPPEMSTYVFDLLRPFAVALLSGVQTLPTDKAEVIWPKIASGVDPSWVASGTEIPQGDPVISKLKSVPKKLAHLISVENEVVDDSEPSIIDVLNNILGKDMALKLDFAFYEGDPDVEGEEESPVGMAFVDGVQHGKKPTKYDPFIEAVGMLEDANVPGPYVAAGPATVKTALELLKNKNEDFLTPPKGMPAYYSSTQLTNTFVYAPGQCIIVPRQDATIEVDRSRKFELDETLMRGKARADLLFPNPEAIVVMDE